MAQLAGRLAGQRSGGPADRQFKSAGRPVGLPARRTAGPPACRPTGQPAGPPARWPAGRPARRSTSHPENSVFGGAEYTKKAPRLHQMIDFAKKQFLRVFGEPAAEYAYVYSVRSPCIQRDSPCIRRPSTCIRRDFGRQVGVFGRKTVYSAGLVYSAKTPRVFGETS